MKNFNSKVKMFIRISVLVLLFSLILSGCVQKTEPEDQVPDPYNDSKKYGLHAENGLIYLNGELFYGMGFCWFDGFYLTNRIDGKEILERYFAKLQEGGIPFMRVMMGCYWPSQIITEYKRNKDKYFERMDLFVSLAEKYHMGIIFSINWNYDAFAAANNEDILAITDPYSKGNAMLRNYVKEVVTRYNDSPAIWGWELGNEANLAQELTEHETEDLPYKIFEVTEITSMYYEIISDEIRKYDPYRMITNGDGGLRGAWRSLRNSFGSEWYPPDTEEDLRELFQFEGSGSIDTLCIHYPDPEKLESYVKMSRDLGYAYYVGEFCSLTKLTSGIEDEGREEAEKGWWEVVNAILESDVQISSHWCWGRYVTEPNDASSVEPGLVTLKDGTVIYQNYYVWENVVKINEDYRSEGKNNSAAYWDSCEPLLYAGK